jgi:NAD-dependent deacetylase
MAIGDIMKEVSHNIIDMKLQKYKNIVVLTGAGVSAASGLRTYRGPDGLWNQPGTEKFSTIDNFSQEPDAYWAFWGKLRQAAMAAEPNKAHTTLAEWEKQMSKEHNFTLITQNVDGLHQRAGSSNVVELHGSILRTRCSGTRCTLLAYKDVEVYSKTPKCPKCGSDLRPDVTLFNEMLPFEAEHLTKRALRTCDLFIAVGTSGTVSPASYLVDWAKYAQARTILVNLEGMNPHNPAFDEEVLGNAEHILPSLLN